MKKLKWLLPLSLFLIACGSNDSPPKDDNIDQDSLQIMDNRQDQDNRNTTSYDSIPDELLKDTVKVDTAKPKQ